jgi:hypothetical protein
MAFVVRQVQFGNYMITTHKEFVKEEFKRLVKSFPKDHVFFNPEVYVKSNLKCEYGQDTITIGVKADGIYLGSDWGYWKILTKRIISTWWSGLKHKFSKMVIGLWH